MIEIRPVNWENIETHYEWNNDPELNYFDSDFPHMKESFDSFARRLRDMSSEDNQHIILMEVFHKNDDKLIGIVDIHDIDPINKRCNIECTIAEPDYRDKGYGTIAFSQAVSYSMEELGMNKVISTAFDFNDKWIRILGNLGFHQEGCLREHALKDGRYSDKLIFGLLNSEYKESVKFQQAV